MTEQTTITNDDLSVKDMVFEMEDRLRHAQDFLDLLNDRLALIGRPIDKRSRAGFRAWRGRQQSRSPRWSSSIMP